MTTDKTPVPGLELTVSCGYASDVGLRREHNEDSLVAADPIFAVADGMGGHEAGEVASSICIRTLMQSRVARQPRPELDPEELQEILVTADEQIRAETGGRAGTTLSGTILVQEGGEPYWLVFNVGDSRTYRLSEGGLEQVTIDHSEVQELVDFGRITPEEALTHPRRHVVTRALGTGSDIDADFWLIPAAVGDRMLVCSDGLINEVGDEQIFDLLTTLAHPQDATGALVQAALRAGGRDNISVIVVDLSGGEPGPLTTETQGL
ncbi:PP2C family protein-serine/threonine phosphatase [Arthrobacter sp. TMN-50]